MQEMQGCLKLLFGLLGVLFFLGMTLCAILGKWDVAIPFGLASIICCLWEIGIGIDILIAKD